MIDSDTLVALFIVFGMFMLLAGVLGYLAGFTSNQSTPWGPRFDDLDDDEDLYEDEIDAEVADLVEPSMEPIPVDPNNPPRTVTYNPRDPHKVHPPCNCHGEAIEVGDEMVHWPLPNQQGILLFHADWLKAQGMSPT